MRVCIFVYKPAEFHSQLFREASALVERGDSVEIIAVHRPWLDAVEERQGFTIRRIAPTLIYQKLSRLPGDILRRLVPPIRRYWPTPQERRARAGAPIRRSFLVRQLQLLDWSIR